jgi:hypothetical protein
MIGLIMLGSIINYLTRSTLSVAAPTLMNDLDIGTQQYSWVVGAFQGAIMLQPLSDEAGPPGPPNFTGAFVGMCCQDYAGTGHPADFDYFEYREREFSPAPSPCA